MEIWVFTPGAAEAHRRIAEKPVVAQVQGGMLAGQNDGRSQAAGGERIRDWGKLDCFGTGPNDQRNI